MTTCVIIFRIREQCQTLFHGVRIGPNGSRPTPVDMSCLKARELISTCTCVILSLLFIHWFKWGWRKQTSMCVWDTVSSKCNRAILVESVAIAFTCDSPLSKLLTGVIWMRLNRSEARCKAAPSSPPVWQAHLQLLAAKPRTSSVWEEILLAARIWTLSPNRMTHLHLLRKARQHSSSGHVSFFVRRDGVENPKKKSAESSRDSIVILKQLFPFEIGLMTDWGKPSYDAYKEKSVSLYIYRCFFFSFFHLCRVFFFSVTYTQLGCTSHS